MNIQIAIVRKILCLAIIFNSIVSMLFAGDILYISYVNRLPWHLYWPYPLEISLLWFVITASLLNIVTAKILGNVDLRRIKFHHYFYGFITSAASFIFMALFAPAYLFVLLMPALISGTYSSTATPLSAAFFLVYGGMTLIIDDMQDMSLRLAELSAVLKRKLQRFKRALEMFHLFCCVVSAYLTLSIIFWTFTNGLYSGGLMLPGLSVGVFTLNLLITSIWGLGIVKKRFWLKNL